MQYIVVGIPEILLRLLIETSFKFRTHVFYFLLKLALYMIMILSYQFLKPVHIVTYTIVFFLVWLLDFFGY